LLSTCFAVFQLLEIHEKESQNCPQNCPAHWQTILSKHCQDCIILNLAQQEAQQDQEKEELHD